MDVPNLTLEDQRGLPCDLVGTGKPSTHEVFKNQAEQVGLRHTLKLEVARKRGMSRKMSFGVEEFDTVERFTQSL